MARLVLHLFGTPRIELDDQPLLIQRRKGAALLAYLATTQRPHHREALATLLFPEYDQISARENFRRILSSLHGKLKHAWLQIDRFTVALPPIADLWVDVSHFHHLVVSTRRHGHRREEACATCLAALSEAAALYTDDFLRGFTLPDSPDFDDWQRSQSEQLRSDLDDVLERLAWGHAAQGAQQTALDYARRRVALDPLHEAAHRQLIHLYAQAGQPTAAHRQYAECVRILAVELGLSPTQETSALVQALKAGQTLSISKLTTQNRSTEISSHQADTSPLETPPSLSASDGGLPAFLTAPAPASVTEQVVFVARRRELTQLRGFLQRMLAGQSQVVLVTGEAGSGKTALLHEFARQAQEIVPDLIVATGACNAYAGLGDPYLPFREIMAMITGDVDALWQAGAISRTQALRLWRLLPDAVEVLLAHGPNLIDTFVSGLALAGRAAAYPLIQGDWGDRLRAQLAQDSHAQRQKHWGRGPNQSRIFEEYTQVLRTLAVARPLLLMLDDLHWADASSISLLFYLGRHLAGRPILIVGSYRSEDVALGWHGEPHPLTEVIHEFERQSGEIRVRLNEASAEGRHFVDALLDVEPNHFDELFRQALFRHSSGHALFTIELLRDLQERRILLKDVNGQWIASSHLDWQTLPVRVEGVIARRIGRLDARLQDTLTIASVEGEEFTAEVVARVQALDERQVVQALGSELDRRHHLVRAQEIRPMGARRLSLYRFRHHLFQKYLYDRLGPAECTYLHEAVGTALEELYGEQQEQLALSAAQLARHFQAAGLTEKAIDYRLLAGQQAVRAAANQEAIDHYEAGLALLYGLPDTPARARRELTLQVALGVPVTATRGYAHSDVELVYTRARALCLQLGETTQLSPVLYGLWRMSGIRGQLQAMQALADEVMALARSAQDPDLLLEAYRAVGITAFHLGESVTARTLLEQGLTLYDRQQHAAHAFHYGHDPAVSCLGYLAHILWLLGYPDQAQERCRQVLHLAEELSHPFSLGHALVWDATILHQLRREGRQVQELAQRGLDLATEHQFPHWINMATILFGWALAEQGQTAAGITRMRQGLAGWQATEAGLNLPYYLALLAEAYRRAGEVETALTLLADALTVVDQTGERWYEAELHRLHGELRWLVGADQPDVERLFQRALTIAQQQQAKSLELRATMSLCRLWQKQGKGTAAHALLAEVYSWFTEGFDTLDLQEARALLEALA
jgi:predicted ATPase/DNA-binding SARP family transcriptional activator